VLSTSGQYLSTWALGGRLWGLRQTGDIRGPPKLDILLLLFREPSFLKRGRV
jgi:hypothetical protein